MLHSYYMTIGIYSIFPKYVVFYRGGISGLSARLPFTSSLILINVGITALGGLIPAKEAAKKIPLWHSKTE